MPTCARSGSPTRPLWSWSSRTTRARSNTPPQWHPGDVYKITGPHHPDRFELATLTSTAGADQARHLASLNPDARRSWLDKQPPSMIMDANWWLHLFLHVDVRIREQPRRRAEWVTLRLWLLDQAASAGVFNPRDYAERRAWFVGELFVRKLTAGLENVLPSADELVHACLTAMPASLAEVRSMADWRNEGLDVMRRLGQAKNLVNAAEYHLHRIDDLAIAVELEQWIRLRPRLA